MKQFSHYSVMLGECLDALDIKEDGIYVDGTLGGAGHSLEICKRLTTGRLIGFDQDSDAIEAATARLKENGQLDKVTIVHSNYENIKSELEKLGVDKVDGILLDLGVSSFQLDTLERGFSYMKDDADLDMRMDRRNPNTADTILNEY